MLRLENASAVTTAGQIVDTPTANCDGGSAPPTNHRARRRERSFRFGNLAQHGNTDHTSLLMQKGDYYASQTRPLITGANQGIGLQIAKQLAEATRKIL